MSTIKTFDPKKVALTIGGDNPTGFAPDTKIVINRANPVSTTTAGIDGDLSINIDSRFNGTATISLLHNSSFNDKLNSWVRSIESTGFIYLDFEMNDPSGSAINTICWVETVPDYSVAQETGTMDWVFGLKDARLLPNVATARISGGSELVRAVLS